MNNKLRGWKIKFLSITGRTTLIKSILNSIPKYTMQINLLPRNITNNMDCIQRNFLCGSSDEKRKIHLINWVTVTMPKSQGGLGIHKSEGKNSALISSFNWRLMKNKSHLWVRILQKKYNNRVSNNIITHNPQTPTQKKA